MRDKLQPFTLVIEGYADPLFFEAIIRDAMKLTPDDGGGFTFRAGASTNHDGSRCEFP